jgi:ubiquinone/menaquinone biosynthesis C-methylase UbiE
MSFDILAPHYRWMEWLSAGGKLQRCRTAFLDVIPAPRRVLFLGEGNGRCLSALLRRYPGAHCTCVDASTSMLERARRRVRALDLSGGEVNFIHADITTWPVPEGEFDLLVTHFFLDCFPAEGLAVVVPRLARAAAPAARWLLADFCEPARGLAKWRARAILWTMYRFFRVVTRLPARALVPPDPYLAASGFHLRERRTFDWGLLHSDWWELPAIGRKDE